MEKRHEIKFDDKDLFFTLHTNYVIDEVVCEAIEAIDGVDKIDREGMGKYSLFFTIGALFNDQDVNKAITKMLNNNIEL